LLAVLAAAFFLRAASARAASFEKPPSVLAGNQLGMRLDLAEGDNEDPSCPRQDAENFASVHCEVTAATHQLWRITAYYSDEAAKAAAFTELVAAKAKIYGPPKKILKPCAHLPGANSRCAVWESWGVRMSLEAQQDLYRERFTFVLESKSLLSRAQKERAKRETQAQLEEKKRAEEKAADAD
jgi:hypothetical protein